MKIVQWRSHWCYVSELFFHREDFLLQDPRPDSRRDLRRAGCPQIR